MVESVIDGEEIATNEKNQMKEADTVDPTVVTEMKHEGKEPKTSHEEDNKNRTLPNSISSPKSPPLVSSPPISSESDSSGITTIGYSDASHRSSHEAGESIRQQAEKESTSFNVLRTELVTSTSHSFENVAIEATDGDKEKSEDSSNDKASSNDVKQSMNSTEVDLNKIVAPDQHRSEGRNPTWYQFVGRK